MKDHYYKNQHGHTKRADYNIAKYMKTASDDKDSAALFKKKNKKNIHQVAKIIPDVTPSQPYIKPAELTDQYPLLRINPRNIKNSDQKHEIVTKQRKLKRILQSKNRKERRSLGVPVQQPKTQEDKRIYDPSIITPYKTNYHPENDLEYIKNFNEQVQQAKQETLAEEENMDEFEEYFKNGKEPKILITTQYNAMLNKAKSASKFTMIFIKELLSCIPNSIFMRRKQYYVKDVLKYAEKNDYTDVMVIGERNNKPSSCLLIHLPHGPSATFRLSFPKLRKDLRNVTQAKIDRDYCQKYYPELILNNFTTRLGYRVARMFQAMFPQKPNFTGRRVVTLHNQRDFIFFRHHIYQFYDVDEKNKGNDHSEYDRDDVYLARNVKQEIEKLNKQLKVVNNEMDIQQSDDEDEEDEMSEEEIANEDDISQRVENHAKKTVTVTKGVKINEIGPRVTFRLQSLQLGKFDNLFGEFEWYGRSELVTDKKQFVI
ncbi:hypothetical protein C9374_007348 [Naegleria lovaniensis]|uniref:Brix domain-containing protein n=1 Tax=Naegleria lovaniensis TaxID=51637 RepID=A0AA88GGX5_NAELO|nr:uncharacterized protein C9374_007348 [Naegleria lovaniensis]KAG2379209.1 hypothetical protein C9374_007348 [Naegleria lovaniensis]